MDVGEQSAEMSWDFCRIFNKPIYYAIRNHLLPVKGKKQFTTLSSSDIVKNFVEFYDGSLNRPLNGANSTQPLVLKVLEVHKLQRINGRSLHGVRIDARVLKTSDTVQTSSEARDRTLIATGSLAEILSRCLEPADIIALTRDRRFMDDVLFAHNLKIPDSWRDIHSSKTVYLNSPFRNNTLVFMYRHDGQFNYRSWTAHMDNLIAELASSLPLDAKLYTSPNHGACVSVSSSRYRKLTKNSSGKHNSLLDDLDCLDSQNLQSDANSIDWHEVYSFRTWIDNPEDTLETASNATGAAETTIVATKANAETRRNEVPARVSLSHSSDACVGASQNQVGTPTKFPIAERPDIVLETQEFDLIDSQVDSHKSLAGFIDIQTAEQAKQVSTLGKRSFTYNTRVFEVVDSEAEIQKNDCN